MGGNYGKSVLYRLENLSRSDLYEHGLRKIQSFPPQQHQRRRPAIAVDCNNIIYAVGRKKFDPVAATANFVDEWAQHGFEVHPIVDGKTPVAKQATMKHIAVREKSKGKAVQKRQELRKLNKSLSNDALTSDQRNKLLEDQKALVKTIRTAESQSIKLVSDDFATSLSEALQSISAHEMNSSGGFVHRVKQ